MPIDWPGIQTAILDRERARLGLPSRMEVEAMRAKKAQEAALQASQLETAALGREKTRADFARQCGGWRMPCLPGRGGRLSNQFEAEAPTRPPT